MAVDTSKPTILRFYEWGICCRDTENVVDAILEGNKTVETRVYPIPEKMILQNVLLIATYGDKRKSKAVGEVIFSGFTIYTCAEDFYKDTKLHLIDEFDTTSPWCWNSNGNNLKYGWIISKVTRFNDEYCLSKRPGIKFSRNMGIYKLK